MANELTESLRIFIQNRSGFTDQQTQQYLIKGNRIIDNIYERERKCESAEILCGKSYSMFMTWDEEKGNKVLVLYLKTCFSLSNKKQTTDMVKIFV